ncbi:Aste57867_14036 [Aphanomyces stellatus]|uniref:Aste57867_14036 protein n=1 Tax=Aphanomyces stellatus TaxID=120398 RepID=A0A485L071_9STRA|nr:hypothetical protein As57867_013985 [Aphanomyces stellatus]VFT90866.1 Aste57867_14036 [Aphanomyces stellatus]
MQDAKACLRAAIILAFGFFFIFTASGGMDNLETSILPAACVGCGASSGVCQLGDVCQDKVPLACDLVCDAPFRECTSALGSTMLGVAYLAFMLSALFGAIVPLTLGDRASLVGSSLSFSLYGLVNLVVASNPSNLRLHWAIMLPAGFISGVASSVAWITQASYLTKLGATYASLTHMPHPSSALGLFNGLFFSIYNMSGIAGNLISSFVLGYLQWPTTILFLVYIVLALCGTTLLCFLPPASAIPSSSTLPPTETSKLVTTPSKTLKSLWSLALDSRMIALAPLMVFHGLQQSFVTGEFTAHVIRPSLGGANIGLVMAVFGSVNVVLSFGVGKLADAIGPFWLQLCGFTAAFVAYSLCLWTSIAPCDGQWALVLATAVLLSLVEATTTTLVNVVLGSEFASDVTHAFSLFRVYHAGSASVSFLLFQFLSFQARVLLLLVVAGLATASFVVFMRRRQKITTGY